MNETQIGAASVRVEIRWLVLVKIYGNKPRKLLITTKMNKLRKLNVEPLNEVGPNKFLNSRCRVDRIEEKIRLIRLGTSQNNGIITEKTMIELSQLEDPLIEDAGSKTENRFVIIFKLH